MPAGFPLVTQPRYMPLEFMANAMLPEPSIAITPPSPPMRPMSSMVSRAIAEWDLSKFEILFIENVGNLVCPSSYDLGEDLRAVLLSATEGEDKPLKYPSIFNSADVAVITKLDLAAAADFDRRTATANILTVRPGMRIVELSAKRGDGMDDWISCVKGARGIACGFE